MCASVRVYVCMRAFMCACMCACTVYVCLCVVRVYVRASICVYIQVCVREGVRGGGGIELSIIVYL